MTKMLESAKMHVAKPQLCPKSSPKMTLQKLTNHTWHEFTDSELLAAFIKRYPSDQCKALALADEILSHYGGFAELLSASPETIQKDFGKYEEIVATLLALPLMAHRISAEVISNTISIDSSAALKSYVNIQKLTRTRKNLGILYLDQSDMLIEDEQTPGNIEQPFVCQGIVKRALSLNAKSLIIIDYRPLVNDKLSDSLQNNFERLKSLLELIELSLHDYCFAYDNEHRSLLEHGRCR